MGREPPGRQGTPRSPGAGTREMGREPPGRQGRQGQKKTPGAEEDAGGLPTEAIRSCFTVGMRGFAFVLLALLATACSGATTPGSSAAQQPLGALEGGSCQYPAGVQVDSSPSGSGCFGGPPAQICIVSNVATINGEDGGVSGGTESCKSLCGAYQYELTCRTATASGVVASSIPDPDPVFGCQIIPGPTPSNVLFYCCPCAN
jgi:hypothetical protein